MKFYVSKSGQRYGPYSLEGLRQEVLANVFRPEVCFFRRRRAWEPMSAVPGIGPLVYAVEADVAHNLLIIRYRGYVRSSAVERCSRDVASSLTRLRPGFRLLADFTDLEAMDVACAPYLEEIMRLCNEKGVSAVVRVIPDPRRDIGLQIMSHFHYGPEVRITTCRSLEEAQTIASLPADLHEIGGEGCGISKMRSIPPLSGVVICARVLGEKNPLAPVMPSPRLIGKPPSNFSRAGGTVQKLRIRSRHHADRRVKEEAIAVFSILAWFS